MKNKFDCLRMIQSQAQSAITASRAPGALCLASKTNIRMKIQTLKLQIFGKSQFQLSKSLFETSSIVYSKIVSMKRERKVRGA